MPRSTTIAPATSEIAIFGRLIQAEDGDLAQTWPVIC